MASNSSRHNLSIFKLRWLSSVLVLLLFLLPTNLFLSLFKESAYVTGMFSDYLVIKIYLSEIILWLYMASIVFLTKPELLQWIKQNLLSNSNRQKIVRFLLLFAVLVSFRQLWTENPLVGLWAIFQWLEVLLLTFFLAFHFVLDQKRFLQTLIIGFSSMLMFQSAIGFSQHIRQQSVLGFALFGEPNLTDTFNIDRFTNSTGQTRILPYGTTAHPNVLGGYLAVISVLLTGLLSFVANPKIKIFIWVVIIVALFVLLLTRSITAQSTFLIGAFSIFLLRNQRIKQKIGIQISQKWKLVGLFLLTALLLPMGLYVLHSILPDTTSIVRRLWLQQAAFQMTLHNPILGTGLSQFVTQLTLFTENSDVWRFLQPVHSVPWLFLSEVGLLGVATLCFLWSSLPPTVKNNVLITIIVLLTPICLDHYLFSLQPGKWLWAITFVGVFVTMQNLKTLKR